MQRRIHTKRRHHNRRKAGYVSTLGDEEKHLVSTPPVVKLVSTLPIAEKKTHSVCDKGHHWERKTSSVGQMMEPHPFDTLERLPAYSVLDHLDILNTFMWKTTKMYTDEVFRYEVQLYHEYRIIIEFQSQQKRKAAQHIVPRGKVSPQQFQRQRRYQYQPRHYQRRHPQSSNVSKKSQPRTTPSLGKNSTRHKNSIQRPKHSRLIARTL